MMKKAPSPDHDNSSQSCGGGGSGSGAGGGHSTSSVSHQMKSLPEGFIPGDDDVICGRGKKCYNHVGNERFRRRVLTMLDEYSRAKTKLDKSAVLSKLVDQVRHCSPSGGFVKQDNSGRWFEVGDFLAREKTSQAFRDALHERYKSSNVSKKKRRQEEQAKASEKLNRIAQSEYEISSRLDRLSSEVLRSHSDPHSFDLFNHANMDMLRRFNTMSDMRHQRGPHFPPMHPGDPMTPSAVRDARIGGSFNTNFPDPLFGSNYYASPGAAGRHSNKSNAETLSDSEVFFRQQQHPEQSAYRPRGVQRSHSFSESSSFEPIDLTVSEVEPLHHSMTSMNASHERKRKSLHSSVHSNSSIGEGSTHHSLPNMGYAQPVATPRDVQGGREYGTGKVTDMEPIPLDQIPVSSPRKSTEDELNIAKLKRPSVISDAKAPPARGTAAQQQQQQQEPISKDLLSCLQKLSDHSIGGTDEFAPIALDTGNVAKPRATQRSFSPIDDEPLDFAEG